MKTRFEIGKVAGSRPASSRAAWSSGTASPNEAMLDPPAPIQPSEMRAARRTASGWWLPTQTGGCGDCTGCVPSVQSSTWKISPW